MPCDYWGHETESILHILRVCHVNHYMALLTGYILKGKRLEYLKDTLIHSKDKNGIQ